MKKKFNIKAGILGLAILAAGAATAAPAVVPQTVMAAETQDANGYYSIVRKINIYYVNEDGSTTFGGSAPYTYSVPNRSMKVTFPEIKVADLFTGGMGYWKPDRETIPAVTATYDNPPAEENIYLRMDTSSYTEESKTITRTVNYYYVDASGKKSTAGVYKDSVTFKRPGYIDSKGNKIMDDWSGDYTFKEIAVQEKAGYTANMTKVPAKTVKPTDSDFTVEVLYSKIPTTTETKDVTRTINYIYKDTNRTFKTYTQKVTLSREVATVNGKTTVVRDWSEGQFSAHKVDAVSGYTADTQTVPALKVTSGSKNSSVNVYFAKSEDNVKDSVSFLVTFTDGQGKTLKTEEVESGKGATAPANPTRSGYTFAGWDKSFSNITAPTTVNAKWTKNNEPVNETKNVSRTVKFVLKYTDGKTSDYKTYTQSAKFSRTGYVDAKGNKVMPDWSSQTWAAIKAPTLDGFVAEKSEVPAVTFTPDTAPGDVVVYLKQLPTKTEYKTVKRTINLIGKNADGTTTSLGKATQSVTINREVYTDANGKTQVKRDWNTGTLGEYKVPDIEGYSHSQKTVPSKSVNVKTKDYEVNVYYTSTRFTVNYHIDENSIASSKKTVVDYGTLTKTLTISELGFEKNNYSFKGWKAYREIDDSWLLKDASGKMKWMKLNNNTLPEGYTFYIYRDGQRVKEMAKRGNTHFYGQWEENKFTVNYHLDEKSGASSKKTEVIYGDLTKTLTMSELGFKKSGKTFSGWKAYREMDDSWLLQDKNGKTKWLKLVKNALPDGYSFYIYRNGQRVRHLAKSGDVHFYGTWK